MGTLAKKAWNGYLVELQLHPLRTKAITAGVLAGISDTAAQKLSGFQRIQLKRLLLKVLFGFAYGGPFGHFMHKLLDMIFKGKKDKKTVAKKVLLEQLTSSPINHLLFLFYYGLVVEGVVVTLAIPKDNRASNWLSPEDNLAPFTGRPWAQVKSTVRKQYPSVQLTAWTFWPLVGWVNHQYMPLQFRVIFHSFIACCWGIFLNLRARSMAITKKA